MIKGALLAAALTGAFCSVFTVVIAAVVDNVPLATAIGLSFASGFCGSLFARYMLRG